MRPPKTLHPALSAEQQHRKEELILALDSLGLTLRADSTLCQTYINQGVVDQWDCQVYI
jgi:hypothetical protein